MPSRALRGTRLKKGCVKMTNNVKFINWKTLLTTLVIVIVVVIVSTDYFGRVKPPGCFRFDDGTVQNWTLDQLYDTNSDPYVKITTAVPGNPPTYTTYTPFSLANHKNIAIEADSPLYLVVDKNVSSTDFYLESPDLSADKNWQDRTGYSLDIWREFGSPCGNPPDSFFAQLQIKIIDTADNSEHTIAETDQLDNFKFHEIKIQVPYNLTWNWGEEIELSNKVLKTGDYKLKHVRVRFTMPGWISDGECFHRGNWRIGNVCPAN